MLDWVAVELGDGAEVATWAEEDGTEEDAAVVEAGAAVATQSQTALAAVWTARPVTAPQAETTQPRAAEAIAADWDELHWQAKSVMAQPTPEPAEAMQDTCP